MSERQWQSGDSAKATMAQRSVRGGARRRQQGVAATSTSDGTGYEKSGLDFKLGFY